MSKLVRNVPVLNSIEMSPRLLLHRLPERDVCGLPSSPWAPRMIGAGASARRRGAPAAATGIGRVPDDDGAPVHSCQCIARPRYSIASRPSAPFTDRDRAARRRVTTLPLELQQRLWYRTTQSWPTVRVSSSRKIAIELARPTGTAGGSPRARPRAARSARCAPANTSCVRNVLAASVRHAEPPHLLHQPILMRAVIPFHAAFGLRGTGRNNLASRAPSHIRPNCVSGTTPAARSASVPART